MHKYQKAAVSLAVLTLILTAGITSAYGYTGDDDGGSDMDTNRKNYSFSSDLQQSVLEAFEESNYQAWLTIVGKESEIAGLISEENFNKFLSARKLARQGRYGKALSLSKELGNELHQVLNLSQGDQKINLTKKIAEAVSALGKSDSEALAKAVEGLSGNRV